VTYTLVRPSSLPYDGSARFGGFFGVVGSTSYAASGDGSQSDDSDATSVTLRSGQDPVGYYAPVVAVDFDAIPDLSDSTTGASFGTMFRLQLLTAEFDGAIYQDDSWALFLNDGTRVTTSRLSDGAGGRAGYVSMDAPTTYETPTTYYPLGGNVPTMRAESFTLAYCFRGAADNGSATIVDLMRVFEAGLILDIGSAEVIYHAPPLRVFPRSDGRGASSAQRVWPRPPTASSGRVGPGSLI